MEFDSIFRDLFSKARAERESREMSGFDGFADPNRGLPRQWLRDEPENNPAHWPALEKLISAIGDSRMY